jgi:hypothetical protein
MVMIPCGGTEECHNKPVTICRSQIIFNLLVCLFIYGLFNNAFNYYAHIVSNDRMISDQRIGKDMEERSCGLI